MIIKSKRFTLRPYRKGDEHSLVDNINDWNIYKYTCNIPHPYTIKIAKWWINKNLKLFKSKNTNEVNFAIDVDGKVVGGIGFKDISPKHKAEIGYWIGKKYRNIGLITEAVRVVTDFGFSKLKFRRIYATVFPANKSSARVLEKNKYILEGKMRNYTKKDGNFIDIFLYSKSK